ncbi:hypothetical protein L202_08149 [Cryptococcus amylolentus CBS 6039]|uniref:UBX domain-containing protein n=2 Tax=Cryptococcus amylolentus TaxID=104669 RepID=A0A1E3HB81_9TREE|nr:hypothetical protein L202_08149 [Cryptococcus amylolentus CBS 6039]ODN72711.1 hypothetical protein L202_08149 [Cryptococcus amylolentus CBS 6039]ODN97918.1 hypothetical protein I350_07554 [Cryptococcus amylolentus CBS 6273]
MGDRQQLLDMGFEADRVDWALRATRNAGLQPAMDHLLNNSDKPIPAAATEEVDEDDEDAVKAHIEKLGGTVDDSDAVAKSIKCTECGKTFRSSATASFHAEKSGHDQFEESTEEIKPLTEEEKAAKLKELRAKLAIKRKAQEKESAAADKANEAIRRKAGQDTGKIREEMKIKEMQKDVERKKREKLEDAKARAAIKAQIEADKKERAEKSAREKALRDGTSAPAPAPAAAAPARPASNVKSSENPETRLQVRMHTGGAPITKTFPSESKLREVAEWIASENLAYDVDTVTLSMTFPRKKFTSADMSKTLKENGLTPSAVIMAN